MFKVIFDFIYNTPLVDILAVITGIIYVILAARNHIACWAFGIVSSALTMYSVYFNMNLFMETYLNGFYVVVGIWGWVNWKKQNEQEAVVIKQLKALQYLWIILAGLLLSFLFGSLFDTFTSTSAPYLDAFTTVFALIATIMVGYRILENWLFWVMVDSVSIYLYSSRGGHFYIILFSIYILVSIMGYFKWRQELRKLEERL
jgi:nicotinamide mononucleotide transporter